MSTTLILNAGQTTPINLVVMSAGENAPVEIGSVSQSFNGADRSSVRGVKRTYGSVTTYVDTATKDSIINLLKWGRQIPCSGDLLGNIQTQCTVRYTAAPMIAGLASLWTVSLSLNEVQPSICLLRYAPGDVITGESFTRASAANYHTLAGLVASAAINVKRDSHYTAIGGTRSILLEDARTNVLVRSQEFDNASWTKSDATISANATTAPDGTATADKLVEAATTQVHFADQTTTMTASSAQAFSVYAKAGERTWLMVQTNLLDGSFLRSWINLSTGAMGTVASGHTVRVTALASAWYRVEVVVGSLTGGSTPLILFATATADAVASFLGDVTKGLYLWGAQHEKDKPFASSYVATVAASVTRSADVYSAPFTTPPQEMSLYAKFVESGTILAVGDIAAISANPAAAPDLQILSVGGFYGTFHANATASISSDSAIAVAPSIGSVVEIESRLFGDGSVDATQSINSGASTASTQTVALTPATAWSGQLFWFNSIATSAVGFICLQSMKVIAGARSLGEMRNA